MEPLSKLLKSKDVVLCGEGYLFELEKRGHVSIGPFVPTVVLETPEAVLQLHRDLVRCGSDIVEAFTYYGHREKLKLVGAEGKTEEINRRAVILAKTVAYEFPGTLVAGNVSNSTIWDDEDEEVKERVRQDMNQQIRIAKEEGADFIIAETINNFNEALTALKTIQKYELESVITMSCRSAEHTSDGIPIVDALTMLAKEGATVVGLNCTRGPQTMLPVLEKIAQKFKEENISTPLAALPVIYNTTPDKPTMQMITNSKCLYMDMESKTCNRYEAADFAEKAYNLGVRYMGICCGGSPYHLRAMAERLGIETIASKYSPDLGKHFAIKNKTHNQTKAFYT